MADFKIDDYDHENVTNIINMLLSDQVEDVILGVSIVEDQFPPNWYFNPLGFYFVNSLVQSKKWRQEQVYHKYWNHLSPQGVRSINMGPNMALHYVG